MSLARRRAAKQAAEREQQLMADIQRRGRERGMSAERISEAQWAAKEEIRRRNLGAEQIMRGLPASPVECCADCYDDFMNG